jgi:hypothetical protein
MTPHIHTDGCLFQDPFENKISQGVIVVVSVNDALLTEKIQVSDISAYPGRNDIE